MIRFLLLCLPFALILGCAEEPPGTNAPADPLAVENPEYRDELLALEAADVAIREELRGGGLQSIPPDYPARQDSVDDANTARLQALIARHGWPTRAMVGTDGLSAAFLIIQHARLPFQQEALPYVRRWYEDDGTPGQWVALLTDRVRQREGKPQLYGTQIDVGPDGAVSVGMIEDSVNVDARRAELGMKPLAEYLEEIRAVYGLSQEGLK